MKFTLKIEMTSSLQNNLGASPNWNNGPSEIEKKFHGVKIME